jgi:hypothetical protein
LYLAARDGWLRSLNKAGEVLPSPSELARQAMSPAQRERRRADRAEKQLQAYRKRFGDLD